MNAYKVKACGATNAVSSGLSEMEIERHAPKSDEVHIEVLYCGVCHSDKSMQDEEMRFRYVINMASLKNS